MSDEQRQIVETMSAGTAKSFDEFTGEMKKTLAKKRKR